MITLSAKPNSLRPLLEFSLEPASTPEHKGMTEQAAIETMRQRRNAVQLGVADAVALHSWSKDERLDAEIERQLDQYSFSCVRLALSFVPDRGCRFVWGRLHAELASNADVAGERPVAFDLFPREVNEKRTVKRTFNLTPKLAFEFGEVTAGGATESELIRYEPRLSVAGLLTGDVTWTFDALDPSGLVGSRELFLVVKHPLGAPVDCRFALAADVTSHLGRVRLRRYTNPELIARQHRLA